MKRAGSGHGQYFSTDQYLSLRTEENRGELKSGQWVSNIELESGSSGTETAELQLGLILLKLSYLS